MNREETDQNNNADDNKDGSAGLGYFGNNTPLFVSMVKAEMDDIKPEFWLECFTCGKKFTNRDDIDFHSTYCQIIEDDFMSTSEVAGSDSGEDTVEMSRKSLSFPNNESILSGLELDREGNNVVHNLSIECSKTTTENVTTPSHVPCQTSYEIENVDEKVLGVVWDDKEVADGIPLPAKENASSSLEKSKVLEIKLSRKLGWIPCQTCGTFLPNQAKLEYHIACRHYSPKIFDDTFNDRDQAREEKETEESDVQFVMEEEILIQSDVRMTRLFQCETCHDFALSEDDLLRHLCRSNSKGQEDSKSLEETDEDEDWIGPSNFAVGKDNLIRDTEKDSDRSLIDKDILNEPSDFDLDSGEVENYAERSDRQLILSKSRSGQISQKSQKTNANCSNRKTREKRGISAVQKEACHTIPRKSERLRKRLGLPGKGQISIGLVEQESDSESMHPSSFNRKSQGKQVRESRRERKLCSDSAPSTKVKSRESRTRKSNKSESKLSSKKGNEMSSPASSGTRPNEKYKHQCPDCLKWFQKKSAVQNHMRSHTGEKPFECSICFRKFTRKESLKRHQSVHTGEKPFECETCHKTFSRDSHLKRHFMSHDGNKPFECDICRQKFSQKSHMERHRKLIHNRVFPFKCRFCPMRFRNQYHITLHERLHMGPRPFKCKLCPKGFPTKRGLTSHQLTHLTERPFECDVCSKEFRTSSDLGKHKKLHSATTQFKCDVCSKTFKFEKYLLSHKNVHISTEPFKCDVCSKTFKREKYLRIHKNTHSDVKLFKCANCQKMFKSADNLYYHRKKQCRKLIVVDAVI